ncbi:hypothetical protein SDC9_208917 [bioreactor metagenome]|uniref:Uncharacterized protein n=1 Tax=bioreactor metagenome TaxID=1076179 RepID=A0A645JNK8_9ZZZZ
MSFPFSGAIGERYGTQKDLSEHKWIRNPIDNSTIPSIPRVFAAIISDILIMITGASSFDIIKALSDVAPIMTTDGALNSPACTAA